MIIQSYDHNNTNPFIIQQMQKQKTLSERPVHIGFGSLKGGVGKSSIAEILASYLYYETFAK